MSTSLLLLLVIAMRACCSATAERSNAALGDDSLRWLLAPLSPEAFFADFFERTPRVFRRSAAHHAALLSMEGVSSLISHLPTTEIKDTRT